MKSRVFSRYCHLLLCGIILLQLVLPAPILADTSPGLSGIKLANTRDNLLTYFTVDNAFSPQTLEAVKNGIPTTFTYYVVLYKTSSSFFDKKIADIQIRPRIKYNSLKEEYTVFRPWKDELPAQTKSLDEALSWMTQVDNLTVLPLDQLAKGDKYQLRIKAELEKTTLPLYLHYVLFFVSLWNYETDWYVINFTY